MKYGTYRDFRANKKEPLSDSLVINYNRFLLPDRPREYKHFFLPES